MSEIQAGTEPGPDHHRLSAADEREQQEEQREPPAGDFRDLPFPKGAGKGAERAGHRTVPAEPCGGIPKR